MNSLQLIILRIATADMYSYNSLQMVSCVWIPTADSYESLQLICIPIIPYSWYTYEWIPTADILLIPSSYILMNALQLIFSRIPRADILMNDLQLIFLWIVTADVYSHNSLQQIYLWMNPYSSYSFNSFSLYTYECLTADIFTNSYCDVLMNDLQLIFL